MSTQPVHDDGEPVILPTPPVPDLGVRIRRRLKHLARPQPKAPPPPPPLYPMVELSYWRPEPHYQAVNFGDELSRTVVELMLSRRSATLSDCVEKTRQLVAIGSVLHTAHEGAVIWGTGLHGTIPEKLHRYRQLDVRATRGPITRRYLRQRGIDAPEVYGDPGLLVPHITSDRFKPTGEFEVGFVPNLHDMSHLEEMRFAARFPQIRLINPLRPWNTVTGDIVRHRLILASSLHGLIIAEAYGIPACYVRLTENERVLKYEDYFEGTGRPLSYASSIEQALDKGGAMLGAYDPKPLMQAFPYDLWGV